MTKLTKHPVVYVPTSPIVDINDISIRKENVFVLTEREIAQLMLLFASQELPFDEFITQNIEL